MTGRWPLVLAFTAVFAWNLWLMHENTRRFHRIMADEMLVSALYDESTCLMANPGGARACSKELAAEDAAFTAWKQVK